MILASTAKCGRKVVIMTEEIKNRENMNRSEEYPIADKYIDICSAICVGCTTYSIRRAVKTLMSNKNSSTKVVYVINAVLSCVSCGIGIKNATTQRTCKTAKIVDKCKNFACNIKSVIMKEG